MATPNQAVGALVMALVIVITLIVGLSITGEIVETEKEVVDRGSEVQTHQKLDGGGTWHQLNSYAGFDETVVTSRGYAVNLTGAPDSYVEATDSLTILENDSWTFATWAYADTVVENQTVYTVDDSLVVWYDADSSDWRVWYYDEGARNSYALAANAPDQPQQYAHLTIQHNQTHLSLYRNATRADTVNITQESTAPTPNTSNWDGRIEETRAFGQSISDATRSALVNNPVEPRVDTNRSLRVMYDEPPKTTQLALFQSGGLDTSNVTYSGGFAGTTLEDTLLTDDYDWRDDGPEIRVNSPTESPVVYIDYTLRKASPTSIVDGIAQAYVLAALLPIVIAALLVISVIGKFGQ